jgi:hypothetical protein
MQIQCNTTRFENQICKSKQSYNHNTNILFILCKDIYMIMIDADLQIILYANIIHDVAKSPIDWYDWLYGPLMRCNIGLCIPWLCVWMLSVEWPQTTFKMQVNTAVTGRWLLRSITFILWGDVCKSGWCNSALIQIRRYWCKCCTWRQCVSVLISNHAKNCTIWV